MIPAFWPACRSLAETWSSASTPICRIPGIHLGAVDALAGQSGRAGRQYGSPLAGRRISHQIVDHARWATASSDGIVDRSADRVGRFQAADAAPVNEIVRLQEKQPFFRGMTRWIGFRQLEVLYDRESRFAGRASPVMSRRVIRYFLESALIAFSGVPLQISTALGLLTSVAGVFVLLYSLDVGWSGGGGAGWIGLLSAVLIVGGLQMLMLGVIGLYLYSVYVELKRRPNYIVEGTLGFESRGERSQPSTRSATQSTLSLRKACGPSPSRPHRRIWLGAQAVNRDAPRDHVQSQPT